MTAPKQRVALFIELNEGERPRVNGWRTKSPRHSIDDWRRWHEWSLNNCHRWWLVECENAEAGREVIAWSLRPPDTKLIEGALTPGRILASGLRARSEGGRG